jgi:N-methylhydantoinase A
VRVAIDVGGTFIDFVALDEDTGQITIEKQPSTPATLVEELLAGLERLPGPIASVDRIFHGTTAGINALVQDRGARVGLLTTAGFRDVLELGRGRRPEVYNTLYQPPAPLVPRHLRREVPERVGADGAVVVPLDLDAVDREVDALRGDGVEAVAICFLHSYIDPSHERAAAARIRERHPDLPLAVSHELTTEWREYERTSTTVLNAYIQPLLGGYVGALSDGLGRRGFARSLALMQSNGGVMSAAATVRRPIRTLVSGPAGGVIGAHALASRLNYPNLICADVGGTTYDVALIERGQIIETTTTTVRGRPIIGSSIDIVSIGAGGGSMAWIDDAGAVHVGPQSAGAVPGPACYGAGGTHATVTDCQLLLGRLDAANFLGARMPLDAAAAARAVETRVAAPAGMSVEDAARGILRIAQTNMTYAIRTLTVERGLDPRDFAMCSYGGGGGLFAAEVAEHLEIATVIVPMAAANFSAVGIMTSDYRDDAARTRIRALIRESCPELRQLLAELAQQVREELEGFGFGADEIEYLYRVDVRYRGQDDTITVPLEEGAIHGDDALLSGAREAFVRMHQRLYGYGEADDALEVVTARCRGTGRVPPPTWRAHAPEAAGAPRCTRGVWFAGTNHHLDTPVFDRDALAIGQVLDGPALIEEWTTTIVVPPRWSAELSGDGHILMTADGSR